MGRTFALLLLAVGLLTGSPDPDPRKMYTVPPRRDDVSVTQADGTENVEVRNDTHLFMTAQIKDQETGRVVQPYLSMPVGSKLLIGPQEYGILSVSNDVAFPWPKGKNARVDVITPGWKDRYKLTPEELVLCQRLAMRTYWSQGILKIIEWLLDTLPSSAREADAELIDALMGATDSLEEFQAKARRGEYGDAAFELVKFVGKDLMTQGPLAKWFEKKLGREVFKDLVAAAIKKIAEFLVPGYGDIKKIQKAITGIFTTTTLSRTLIDLRSTGAKLSYDVYFDPGVGIMYPDVIRTGTPNEITITGWGLRSSSGETTVRFEDRVVGKVFSGTPEWVSSQESSSMLKITIPPSAIANVTGPLTAILTINGKDFRVPDQIRIIQVLQLNSIDPPLGAPGEQIEISGVGLMPYGVVNDLYFGKGIQRRKAEIQVMGSDRIVAIVPGEVVASNEEWDVWISESHGSVTKESNKLNFTLTPGTPEQDRARRRDALMPASSEEFEGTLTTAGPQPYEPIGVPAGMQIKVALSDVSGGPLETFGVFLETKGEDGSDRVIRVADFAQNVPPSQPNLTYTHTTEGDQGYHFYRVFLKKGPGSTPVKYKFKVEKFARDDLGAGQEAGNAPVRAVRLPPSRRLRAHLFAEKRRGFEDLVDFYRVGPIPADKELVVRVGGVSGQMPFTNDQAALSRVTLFEDDGNGALSQVGLHAQRVALNSSDVVMRHGSRRLRTYYLKVEGGEGNAEYWINTEVQQFLGTNPTPPTTPTTNRPVAPVAPVVSDFQRDDEGWKLNGNYETGLSAPFRDVRDNGRLAWLKSEDKGAPASPPLDLVLVVDTTGSMGPAIDGVRKSAQEIIRKLSEKTNQLRVGLVAYKDVAADGATSRQLLPLSSEIDPQFQRMNAWTASGGGSDKPEDLLHALKGALEMPWRDKSPTGQDVAKVVVMITDAAAKVNESGADFEGSTFATIHQTARRKGVRFFGMLVGTDKDADNSLYRLSFNTGGSLFSYADTTKAAARILEIADVAIERSSPVYWVAPPKFLGGKIGYYGKSLEFRVTSDVDLDYKERFDADDVILVGSDRTLSLRTYLRPISRYFGGVWYAVAVKLDESSRWVDSTTGDAATKGAVENVLRDLKAVKIRADYFLGTDSLGIDDVKMGTDAPATDIGLRDSAVIGVRQLDDFRRLVEQQETFMKKEYYDHEEMKGLREALRQAGAKSIDTIVFTMPGEAWLPLFGLGGTGDRMFRDTLAEVEKNIVHLRRTGILLKADHDKMIDGINAWNAQMKIIRDKMRERLPLVAGMLTVDEQLLTTNDAAARVRLYDRRSAFEERDRPIKEAIEAIGKPLPFKFPG